MIDHYWSYTNLYSSNMISFPCFFHFIRMFLGFVNPPWALAWWTTITWHTVSTGKRQENAEQSRRRATTFIRSSGSSEFYPRVKSLEIVISDWYSHWFLEGDCFSAFLCVREKFLGGDSFGNFIDTYLYYGHTDSDLCVLRFGTVSFWEPQVIKNKSHHVKWTSHFNGSLNRFYLITVFHATWNCINELQQFPSLCSEACYFRPLCAPPELQSWGHPLKVFPIWPTIQRTGSNKKRGEVQGRT